MKKNNLKIVFLGTPEIGAVVLEKMTKSGFCPSLAFTASDKPAGRKMAVTPPPVKTVAEKYGISVIQEEDGQKLASKIKKEKPDLGIVIAYSKILPKEVVSFPKYGFLNIHPSLLPKHRGPSPIQYTILKGDKETGVTIILMDEKTDHGPVVQKESFKILDRPTCSELTKQLADLSSDLIVKTISLWIKGKIKPKPQNHSKATYTKKIKKEDGKINWAEEARIIEKKIRAFNSWPGAYCFFEKKRLKILSASILKNTPKSPVGVPGKTFWGSNDKIAVQTGKDYLLIEKLQIEGKKEITSQDFLNGFPDFIGSVLK